MKVFIHPSEDQWNEIISRPVLDNESLFKGIRKILLDVKKGGDRSIRKYTKKFDGATLRKLRISDRDIKKASEKIDLHLKEAMETAIENISKFHSIQKEPSVIVETMPGVRCWRKSVPIERVGIYIPGGSAPLFSSVLMLAVPAKISGCKKIVLCTPPSAEGTIHPAILFAAHLVGITEIYACGGAQAIAAMAYGTETVPKVDKIFGPGNQYVTAAKQLVQLEGVAIDMPAGPSEVCVLSDETGIPSYIASDLLSQAEHGPDSQVLFISTDKSILDTAISELDKQLKQLPRATIASKALENSTAVLVENMEKGLQLVNAYAAEHLIIASEKAIEYAEKVINAGSVFLGSNSPESAGDYASGTNHTLPTNGHARAYSGVSVDSFVRKITFQQINEEGINTIGNTIVTMAIAEGLDAHAKAVKIRLKK
jgi:histidinol dehydrogenase